MRRILIAAACLMLAGCMAGPTIVASASDCPALVPPDWAKGIAMANLPAAAAAELDASASWEARYHAAVDEQKKWENFAIDTANRLDQANGRYTDAMGIIGRCEARNDKAVQKAKPKVLGLF